MSRRFHSGAVAALILALFMGFVALAEESERGSPPSDAPGCDRFASASGADHGARRGGFRHPFRTVPRLLRSLRPGETGCLEQGVYRHDDFAQMRQPGITLRGIGPGWAQIQSPIWIMPSATGARLHGVSLTSRNEEYPEPLKVQADRARVAGNRITGSTNTICVLIGSQRRTHGVTIDGNWIRHCGRHGKLDHLIYVQNAVGTTIRGNLLTSNPGGWAVHLYPDADRSLVEHNVIDGNRGGVIFAGEEESASDSNVVRQNAITFSAPRWNVESSWSGDPGGGNRAYSNCLFSVGPDGPAGIGELDGFSASGNTVLSGSPYADREAGDYAFLPDSPCRALVGDVAQATVAGQASQR